jgi:glycosyltransferase involved in cell wall biosynthesis
VKILIISQYFWPENLRINDLTTELQERGHEITILTGLPNYPEGKLYEEFRAEPEKFRSFHGSEILRVPVIPRRDGRALWLGLNYVSFVFYACLLGPWKLRKRCFDAIFVFGPSPITACIPAILLKRIKKAPISFWVLDLWPESLSAVGAITSKCILAGFAAVVRFIYRHCDLVLAQSHSFVSGIGKYCADARKIRYFPSWSEELFKSAEIQPAPEVPQQRDGFTVLFAGNIGDAQDFPTVLKAAEKLSEHRHIRWVVVGDGRMSAWVREQITVRGLQDCVLMPGRFPLSRMPSFFCHADALLVSLKENEIFSMTIPGKVQTYLTSGLPLIGSIDGEGANVIRESGAGYATKAGDADALADAVLKMSILDPQARAQMGAAGMAYYSAQFDKKLLFDRLEAMLREIAVMKPTK